MTLYFLISEHIIHLPMDRVYGFGFGEFEIYVGKGYFPGKVHGSVVNTPGVKHQAVKIGYGDLHGLMAEAGAGFIEYDQPGL